MQRIYLYNCVTLFFKINFAYALIERVYTVNYIRKIKLCNALNESARLLISPGASAINESFTFMCINLIKVLCRPTFQRVIYDGMRHRDHAILLNGGLLLSRARTRYSRVRVHATQTLYFKRITKITRSVVSSTHILFTYIILHTTFKNFQSLYLRKIQFYISFFIFYFSEIFIERKNAIYLKEKEIL